jgi:hypothetical protein
VDKFNLIQEWQIVLFSGGKLQITRLNDFYGIDIIDEEVNP